MKKILTLTLAALLVLMTLTACGGKKETSDDSKKNDSVTESTQKPEEKTYDFDTAEFSLLNEGVLTVGCEIGYPPFEQYASDGKTPVGFDIDMANEIADRLGLKVEFINTKFDTIFEGLGKNYDVVISGITINKERAEKMILSEPYIDNYQAIVVKADSKLTAKSLNDINGHSIAFQKGTTTDEIIAELTKTGTVKCTSAANEKILTCFQQLSQGEVEMVVCDSTVASVQLAKDPGKYKIIFQDEENPEQFGIAIPKTNTKLADAINTLIKDLKEEGFFEELNKDWFGK